MDVTVKQAASDRWLAFWATMSGWILDAFDYNILAIILLDIQKSFTVDSALAGALATVTSSCASSARVAPAPRRTGSAASCR
jgi:hypothetical protein